MFRSSRIIAAAALFAAMAFAETWTGTLVDASCMDQRKSGSQCAPTSSTSAFALIVADKVFKLDESGNSKASDAVNSADRTKNPGAKQSVTAKVTGSISDETIQVESIEVQ